MAIDEPTRWHPRSRWDRLKTAWEVRRLHVFYNGIWIIIGFLSVFAGIGYFIDPHTLLHQTGIGQQLNDWAYGWSAFYLIGGLLMLVGDLKPNVSFKVVGLIVFAGAILIEIVGILAQNGWQGSIPTLAGFVIAALGRVYALMTIKVFPEDLRWPRDF